MLQYLETLILASIRMVFTLGVDATIILFVVPAVILLAIQTYKRNETVLPGIGGVTFIALAALHYFGRAHVVTYLDNLIEVHANPEVSRNPIPLVEPLFNFFVGPSSSRYPYQEAIFVGFLIYIAFVIYHIKRNAGGAPAPAPTVSLFSFFTSRTRRPKRSDTNELGSADLATEDQISKWIRPSEPSSDTSLAVSDLRGSEKAFFKTARLYIPKEERNRHVLAIAKTGSGKTTKLILPILYSDCLSPERSTIVIDSKPEMWKKLAAMTRKHNPEKQIILFNPLDTMRSLSWNILSKIEDETDCKLIANTIIMATDQPQAKSDSPFFRNNALSILNAIMVGLLHDPKETLSMPRIHELVQSGMKPLCSWLEQHPNAYRTTRTFVELARSGSQNADTIMSELSMRLQAWDLPDIRATTSKDELDIEDLIRKPTLFIVELRESELEMLRPMANVIVVEILRFLTKRAEHSPGVTLPRPVGLVIDEFASSLGRLPDIHVKLNTLRSRNVSIVAAIQSIAQIKANYGDDADSVLAGFSTKIFMPALDLQDAEWASKETGQMTIRFLTASRGKNKKLTEVFASKNDSTQEQVQQRAVLTPDEIGRPADNISTFFMPNTPAFQGHLVPFYKIPEMLKRLSEFDSDELELKLRAEAIKFDDKLPDAPDPAQQAAAAATNGLPPGITNTKGWTDDQIKTKLEEVRKKLDWDNTTGSARKWWEAFESENKHRVALVLRLAEELANRKATITEFFLAYVYSNTDNIQANLCYLDYTRLKKEEERKRREASEKTAAGGGGGQAAA